MNTDRLFRDLPDSFEEPKAVEAPPPPPPSDFAWGLAASTLLWLGGTFGTLWLVVPRFADVFSQVRIQLPPLTMTVVSVSWFVCRLPWIFGGVALAVAAWTGVWDEKARRAARLLLPLAIALTAFLMILALFLPMIGTLEGVRR